jgi:hypothetical protein
MNLYICRDDRDGDSSDLLVRAKDVDECKRYWRDALRLPRKSGNSPQDDLQMYGCISPSFMDVPLLILLVPDDGGGRHTMDTLVIT